MPVPGLWSCRCWLLQPATRCHSGGRVRPGGQTGLCSSVFSFMVYSFLMIGLGIGLAVDPDFGQALGDHLGEGLASGEGELRDEACRL